MIGQLVLLIFLLSTVISSIAIVAACILSARTRSIYDEMESLDAEAKALRDLQALYEETASDKLLPKGSA